MLPLLHFIEKGQSHAPVANNQMSPQLEILGKHKLKRTFTLPTASRKKSDFFFLNHSKNKLGKALIFVVFFHILRKKKDIAGDRAEPRD